MSSDGGALLLGEAERKLKLIERFSQCFLDGRKPALVEHRIEQLLAQRIYGLALGYEDLNDHEQLRHDPLLGALAGKAEPGKEPLAGKSTLNRMELGDGTPNRYKKITFWREAIDDLLVDVFLEAHAVAPEQIVLDIDTTDFAIHGEQEGRFYHGYYDHYCYLPLYVFAGEHVLCARLRPSNIDPSAGSRKRDRAHREADSRSLAGSADRAARRCGLLPGRADGVVRSPSGGLCVRHGAQFSPGEDGGRGTGTSTPAMGAERNKRPAYSWSSNMKR